MTHEEIIKNIESQPVGRATLVVNDRCGDPSNYLYKINSLALHKPDLVRAMAISIMSYGDDFDSDSIKRIVDKHYNNKK
jgi:hypothetical protein